MAKRPSERNLRVYKIMRIVAIVLFSSLCLQLFRLQVVQHDMYESQAIEQQTKDISIAPKRGTITDRNGDALAISASAYKVVMAPSVIKTDEERESIADGLSTALGMDRKKIYEMTKKNTSYVEVARRIEKESADAVSKFVDSKKEYSGIITIAEDPKRYYPNGNMLSTVLGFVGSDNQGLEGLEYEYDSYLKGSPGKVIATKTSIGTAMPFEYEKQIDAVDGSTVQLTIDNEIQAFLETHIENARVEHNVQNKVSGIVMSVKTGEVLGMASKPDYDPNTPFTISDEIVLNGLKQYSGEEYSQNYNYMVAELRKNKALEQYEPGSTFKIITSSIALEEGLVSLTETFNCTGSYKVGSITLHCAKTTGHGTEDFKNGLANSCNPVFMKIGERIGVQKYYDYVTMFGFREKTGVGLPGEQEGLHHGVDMTPLDLANSVIGQSFKVTPIQLITAVCSVANKGNYMKPYIIKDIVDTKGNMIVSNEPTLVRKTVSEKTSDLLREYLEYAVVKGKVGFLEGYKIAGKTGTSQKLDTRVDGQDNDKRIASFVCFAPADDPEIAVIVVVDEPNSDVQYGSLIAQPVARDIIKDCLDHLRVEPDFGTGETVLTVSVPDVNGFSITDATSTLAKQNLVATVVGSGQTVLSQLPADGVKIPEGGGVLLFTEKEKTETKATVPDVVGKTAAECNRLLVNSGLNIKVIGENINYPSTVAVSQSIPAGEVVDKMTVVTVKLEKLG